MFYACIYKRPHNRYWGQVLSYNPNDWRSSENYAVDRSGNFMCSPSFYTYKEANDWLNKNLDEINIKRN